MSNFVDLDSIYRDRLEYPNPCDYKVTATQVKEWSRNTRSKDYSVDNSLLHTCRIDSLLMPYPRVELFGDIIEITSVALAVFTLNGHPFSTNDIIESLDATTGNQIVPKTQYEINVIDANTFNIRAIGGGANISIPAQTFNARNSLRVVKVTAAVQTALTNALQLLQEPRLYIDFDCETYKNIDVLSSMYNTHRMDKFVMTYDKIQYDDKGRGMWVIYKTKSTPTIRFQIGDPLIVKISDRYGSPIDWFNDNSTTTLPNPDKQTLLTLSVTPYLRDNYYNTSTNVSEVRLL